MIVIVINRELIYDIFIPKTSTLSETIKSQIFPLKTWKLFFFSKTSFASLFIQSFKKKTGDMAQWTDDHWNTIFLYKTYTKKILFSSSQKAFRKHLKDFSCKHSRRFICALLKPKSQDENGFEFPVFFFYNSLQKKNIFKLIKTNKLNGESCFSISLRSE